MTGQNGDGKSAVPEEAERTTTTKARQLNLHGRLRSSRVATRAPDSSARTSSPLAPALHHGPPNPRPRRTCSARRRRPR